MIAQTAFTAPATDAYNFMSTKIAHYANRLKALLQAHAHSVEILSPQGLWERGLAWGLHAQQQGRQRGRPQVGCPK